jgi:SOS-response transcriptional repressor LexA
MESLLKTKRLEKKLTLEQVGEIVGVGKSTVRKWENGLIENMGRDKIVSLSKALDISPLDILGIDKSEKQQSAIKTILDNVFQELESNRQHKVVNFAEKQLEKQNSEIGEAAIYQISNIKKFDDSDFINVPELGEIAAGLPIYAEENFNGYRPVSSQYGEPEDLFWIRARGDSMKDLIYNKDYVLIEKTPRVENGEIAAVFFTTENSATLKYVYKEKNRLRLVAENDDYDDIIADESNPAVILGRAIKIERDI